MTKRAKTLDKQMLTKVLDHVKSGAHPERDKVMLLLSHLGGLRAAEIAGLTWGDVLDASSNLSKTVLSIPAAIAKKGKGRDIPMHPDVYAALQAYQTILGDVSAPDPLMTSTYTPHMSANYVAVYIRRVYKKCGFIGCSSHSGRRTFLTKLARSSNNYGCSLHDVQRIAGHANINTTEAYIEPSERAGAMVAAL